MVYATIRQAKDAAGQVAGNGDVNGGLNGGLKRAIRLYRGDAPPQGQDPGLGYFALTGHVDPEGGANNIG